MVGYATGQTDEWRGTGVWSGLSLKRDDKEEEKKESTSDTATKKEQKQPSTQEQK
eukprot:CAMPEP_0113456162 /NCGR_PEP_ID=MMETSP0014_2-20120614/8745_1 /TAXON_ID=2857 /ORGANISM="Nitzschia sp." /LENGTH=54 /DNA_ID=CAMNT_0000347607 /DNA_START=2114 /DNA_END=2278 /DNA_ORIENTATION=+ /assembly_acc=CAM_ASM_000159